MKPKISQAHMATAHIYAQLSHARRLKVGAIAVKDGRIISIGYNGMPAGWDNNCEDKEWWDTDLEDLHPDEVNTMYPHYGEHQVGEWIQNGRYRLRTKPEVLHAESNCIAKLARSNESGLDADLFVTHAPCIDCAKLIFQSGFKRVFFGAAYRDDSGIRFLKNSGVAVEQIE